LLQWFYQADKDQYFDSPVSSTTECSLGQSPEHLVYLYELADKYLLDGLKIEVEAYFNASIFSTDTFHGTTMAVQHVYSMHEDVGKTLHAILLDNVVSCRKALCGGSSVLAACFRQLILTAPREFVADITIKLGNRK